jgi:hypothetical protein
MGFCLLGCPTHLNNLPLSRWLFFLNYQIGAIPNSSLFIYIFLKISFLKYIDDLYTMVILFCAIEGRLARMKNNKYIVFDIRKLLHYIRVSITIQIHSNYKYKFSATYYRANTKFSCVYSLEGRAYSILYFLTFSAMQQAQRFRWLKRFILFISIWLIIHSAYITMMD